MSAKMQVWRWLSAILSAETLAGVTRRPGRRADAAAVTAHRGMLPPNHPAVSLPNPDLLTSCGPGDDGIACNQLALATISRARKALEKLGGMSFSLGPTRSSHRFSSCSWW